MCSQCHKREAAPNRKRCQHCIDGQNARQRTYRDRHPEIVTADNAKRRVAQLEWQKQNRASSTKRQKEWIKAHPAEAKGYADKWKKANPEKMALKEFRYRARKQNAAGVCSAEQLLARVAVFGGKCWVPGCGKRYTEIDHVLPLSKGGTNWPANLRPICSWHNRSKGNRHWKEVANG